MRAPPLRTYQYWEKTVNINRTRTYALQDEYYNLDPRPFGLDYDIFVNETIVVTSLGGAASTVGSSPTYDKRSFAGSPQGLTGSLKKRATLALSVCYPDCSKLSQPILYFRTFTDTLVLRRRSA